MEEWRPVVGFEGVYEVSNLGRVKRIKPANGATVGRILKQCLNTGGYPMARLVVGGRGGTPPVHRLVAAAFIGPRPKGMQINHKDGDKTNAAVSNLEYCTAAENTCHAYDVLGRLFVIRGMKAVGEKNGSSRLTADDVQRIRQLSRDGVGTVKIAAMFGLERNHAHRIISGRYWKHLPL